jgi:hypothetical protein
MAYSPIERGLAELLVSFEKIELLIQVCNNLDYGK